MNGVKGGYPYYINMLPPQTSSSFVVPLRSTDGEILSCGGMGEFPLPLLFSLYLHPFLVRGWFPQSPSSCLYPLGASFALMLLLWLPLVSCPDWRTSGTFYSYPLFRLFFPSVGGPYCQVGLIWGAECRFFCVCEAFLSGLTLSGCFCYQQWNSSRVVWSAFLRLCVVEEDSVTRRIYHAKNVVTGHVVVAVTFRTNFFLSFFFTLHVVPTNSWVYPARIPPSRLRLYTDPIGST